MPICPNCGANIADVNAQFCPSCGATLASVSNPTTPPPISASPSYGSPTYGATTPPMKGARPTGITILAVLEILGGLALLLGGAGLAIVGAVLGSGLVAALGGLSVILGLVSFVVAYGLWTGRPWAWTIALVLGGINVLLGIVSIASGGYGSVFGLLISLIIIYYLTRPHVRVYFGK
jgi:hypothetical protein